MSDNAEAALRREIKMAEEAEQRRLGRKRLERLGDPDE